MATGKGLPDDVSDFLREQVRAWLDADSKRTQAELARLAGIRPPTLSNLLKEFRGAGYQSASGLARALGYDINELIGRSATAAELRRAAAAQARAQGAPAEESERPELRNRPGWAEAAAEALRRYSAEVAPFSVLLAERVRGLSSPDPITPEFVRAVALLCQRFTPDEERERAAEEIAHRARHDGQARHDEYEAQASAAAARGRPAPLPPVTESPRSRNPTRHHLPRKMGTTAKAASGQRAPSTQGTKDIP